MFFRKVLTFRPIKTANRILQKMFNRHFIHLSYSEFTNQLCIWWGKKTVFHFQHKSQRILLLINYLRGGQNAPFLCILSRSENHSRCHLGQIRDYKSPRPSVGGHTVSGGEIDWGAQTVFLQFQAPPLSLGRRRCFVCTCEKWRAVYVIFVVIGPCRINLNFHHSLVLCQWVYSRFKL